MAELQEIINTLQQLAATFPGKIVWLTALFTTCFVPFLKSFSKLLAALREASMEVRKLMQEGQEWKRLLKPSSANKIER